MKIKITQIRSAIRRPKDQGATLKALGLKRINDSIIKENSPCIAGMIFKVKHLVKSEKISE